MGVNAIRSCSAAGKRPAAEIPSVVNQKYVAFLIHHASLK